MIPLRVKLYAIVHIIDLRTYHNYVLDFVMYMYNYTVTVFIKQGIHV